MFKKISVLLLALVFALAFVGCTMGGANGELNYRLGIVTDPLTGEVVTTENRHDTNDPFDVSDEWLAVYLDGEGIPGSYFLILDSDGEIVNPEESGEYLSATHVPLFLVAQALGATVTWLEDSNEVTMDGLNGSISFEAGTNEFTVGGESISLGEVSAVIDGTLYVPLMFFRDVYGAASVSVQGGEVHINVHAQDDNDDADNETENDNESNNDVNDDDMNDNDMS